MKALTICQPYAHLIAIGQKRVENRTWPTRYRGPLLIHAGKSREWLDVQPCSDMDFGSVVAVADLVDCIDFNHLFKTAMWDKKYPWLREHEHTNGPWCWILDNVRRLDDPIEARGAQGLFNLDVRL